MKHVIPVLVLLIASMLGPGSSLGQDPLAGHKVKGLKGLRTLALVIRPNTPREVASLKEWADMVELRLHRNVPDLTLSDAANAPAWLELSIITTEAGGFLELSVYRWVKVLASGEETFSKVWWDSRAIFGGVSKEALQDSLDTLLTSFAADYFRAKR
ncbi:MAG: hypothetical protein HYY46_07570 [Deltaproteobacteria bacterium]|nr:hypothetical protein [Deltaproteobacteria bacterium]